MTFNANKVATGGSKFTPAAPVEVGTYPARLVQLIDLGVQPRKPYQGQEKDPIQMIWVTYELTNEFMKDESGNDIEDKPRWISESFPFYNLKADRAKSTARYMALDPQVEKGGNWDQLLGCPVSVSVVHNQSGDRTFANIGNTAPVMKGMPVDELKNETVVFSLDEPDLEVFNALPEFLQEKIKGNINYQGSALATLLGGGTVAAPQVEEPAENPFG